MSNSLKSNGLPIIILIIFKPNSHFPNFNYLLNVSLILMLIISDTYDTFKYYFIKINKLIQNLKKKNLRI